MNQQPRLADSHDLPLRPWLLGGLTVLLVARPLFPSESAANSGDGLAVVMLWIALSVFWLVVAVGRPSNCWSGSCTAAPLRKRRGGSATAIPTVVAVGQPKFSIRFGWTDAAVGLLIVWHSVAALWAAFHGSPRPAVNMLWEWISLGLCFFMVRQLVATERERRAIVGVMIALAVALAGYGLYQYAYEMPQTQARYATDPDRALRDAGLWLPPDSPQRKLFEDRLHNAEPIATFALTNSLAAFLCRGWLCWRR